MASAAEDYFCIHGYASDSVTAAAATPTQWLWWVNGWSTSPVPGIPANVAGFSAYGKKSWMTETSGEDPAWLYPTSGFPGGGAFSIALRIQQALTAGRESAWAYWQMTDGSPVGAETMTDSSTLQNWPKYVAAKHFFKYIRLALGNLRLEFDFCGLTFLDLLTQLPSSLPLYPPPGSSLITRVFTLFDGRDAMLKN